MIVYNDNDGNNTNNNDNNDNNISNSNNDKNDNNNNIFTKVVPLRSHFGSRYTLIEKRKRKIESELIILILQLVIK